MNAPSDSSRFDRAIKVIQLGVAIVGTIGLYLAWLSLNQSATHAEAAYDQQRREFVMRLYDNWRDVLDTGNAREHMKWISDPVREDDELAAVAAGMAIPNSSLDSPEVQRDVVRVLNMFEKIAVAERDGVADSEMIKAYFSKPMIRYFNGMKRFIAKWEQIEKDGWPDLQGVISAWEQKPAGQGAINPNKP